MERLFFWGADAFRRGGENARCSKATETTIVAVVNQQPQPAMFCATCRGVFPIEAATCDRDGSPLERVDQILAGRYALKHVLGSGNMGTVYRAVQLSMGREVAVKLMHSDLVRNPDLVERFEREAQAAATVDHPNAITIYDSGRSSDGQVYIAMELLDGESLSSLIERQTRLPPDRALELWLPAVKAMVVAHRRGVIHRDLKPDNIFVARRLSEDGSEEEVVKVLDFGIAKLIQGGKRANQTVAGARIGTAMYMSPEQLEGREASPRSDVYALGLLLIEMLTGRLPWGKTGTETDQATTMLRLINPPKRLREICGGQVFSPELQRLLDEILAFAPENRPADAGDVILRLGQVPEAAPLALRSLRRSEGSQMFEAGALTAKLKSQLLADTPLLGTELPKDITVRTPRSSDTPTPFLTPVPTIVTAKSPSEGRKNGVPNNPVELASVPTVVTASRPDMPRFPAPAQSQRFDVPRSSSQRFDVPQSSSQRFNIPRIPSQPFDVPRSSSQRFEAPTPQPGTDLPSVPTVLTPSMGARSNAPTAIQRSASSAALALSTDPATQPLPVARSPKSSEGNTLRKLAGLRGLAGTWLNTQRKTPWIIAGALRLLFGGTLIAFQGDKKATPKMLNPDPGSTTRPTEFKPPPTRPPVVPPLEHPLTVDFLRKRHPKAFVQCGTRPCVAGCQLAPGEACVAKAQGFRPRQYSYDELKSLASGGRVEVDLRLTR
jgi:serine/threonine protein kinase